MSKKDLATVLSEQQDNLLEQYGKLVESNQNNRFANTKQCVEILRLIKESARMLDEHSYKRMSSHYKMKIGEDFVPVISIWEQNNEGQIKNHRIWTVGEELEIGSLRPIKKKD